MEFFLNLAFSRGKPLSKDRVLKTDPERGDMLVQACEPNPSSGILRFARVAKFFIPMGDHKDVVELFDPVIVHASTGYMEVHGYERTDDGFYVQSWILRPTMVDGARSSGAHIHTGQPGHTGYRGTDIAPSE
ncbi:hypothetical protein ACFQUU_08865 [Herbaspirillum sp. GCM10030257]|uniref:hypothetical protein n=1 Tax=Herbaspirillum sp. GCM10030257 TaxID=3273393 RepID=UPI0036177C37